MNIILPIAGRSSRFPDMKPKWMLTHPRGDMMLVEAIKGLDLEQVKRIYVVGLAEQEKNYDFVSSLNVQFNNLGISDKIEYVLLEEHTKNQPETIAQAIIQAGITGAIYIKDSDNYFIDKPEKCNAVASFDLHDLEYVNARNKSYIELNADNNIINIVEKQIVSSSFCVGGYGFESAELFIKYYDRLKNNHDLYISHIIFQMIADGIIFKHRYVSSYTDWGTIKEWNTYKAQYCTLFVDLDGTLVINSGQYSSPKWGETNGIDDNITTLNTLFDTGKVQVVITTSRKESFRKATEEQLNRLGIKYHRIIYDLAHGRRIVINDYAKSNPYKSCDAINIQRNGTELKEMLEDSIGHYIISPKKNEA